MWLASVKASRTRYGLYYYQKLKNTANKEWDTQIRKDINRTYSEFKHF